MIDPADCTSHHATKDIVLPDQLERARLPAVWESYAIRAPGLEQPVPVVATRTVPYGAGANRLQTLNIYLPLNRDTEALVGRPVEILPAAGPLGSVRFQVHIHGGAWRDPMLDAASIEAAAALTFASPDASPLVAVASLNYSLTQFPNHPAAPYDAVADGHADPAREAVHPRHVRDVLDGLALLRSLGLEDGSYVLSAHSCGACIALQAVLAGPAAFGLAETPEPPTPAAFVGVNGLYDLPGLVLGLGPAHEINSHDYRVMLTNAFGPDDRVWAAASPARLSPTMIAERIAHGRAPRLAHLLQSPADQLVPMEQLRRLADNLKLVDGLAVHQGRCDGKHSEPWQQGVIVRDAVRETLRLLGP